MSTETLPLVVIKQHTPRDGSLPAKISAELIKETIFPMTGRGGLVSEAHDRNQACGHRGKEFCQHVRWFISTKATRLVCARQKRMAESSTEAVKVSTSTRTFSGRSTLIMIHLSEQCFVLSPVTHLSMYQGRTPKARRDS